MCKTATQGWISGIYECLAQRMHQTCAASAALRSIVRFGAGKTSNVHNLLSPGSSVKHNYSDKPKMSLCGGRREQGGLILKLQSSIHPWWLLESPITHQQNMIAQFFSSLESYQYGCRRPQETQLWPSCSELWQDKQCFIINTLQWAESCTYPIHIANAYATTYQTQPPTKSKCANIVQVMWVTGEKWQNCSLRLTV